MFRVFKPASRPHTRSGKPNRLSLRHLYVAGAVALSTTGPAVTIATERPSTAAIATVDDTTSWRRIHGPEEIAPPGWRRVGGRWERTDGRPLPDLAPGRTINHLIREQRQLEASCPTRRWLDALLRYLRATDPITLASAEISAFCLLAYRVLRRD